jgi:hypothetical protein
MVKGVKKNKKSARVVGRGRDYWTTVDEFWNWQKQGLIVKTGDNPLTGVWVDSAPHPRVLINHMILDRRCPSHLAEVLQSRNLVRKKSRSS